MDQLQRNTKILGRPEAADVVGNGCMSVVVRVRPSMCADSDEVWKLCERDGDAANGQFMLEAQAGLCVNEYAKRNALISCTTVAFLPHDSCMSADYRELSPAVRQALERWQSGEPRAERERHVGALKESASFAVLAFSSLPANCVSLQDYINANVPDNCGRRSALTLEMRSVCVAVDVELHCILMQAVCILDAFQSEDPYFRHNDLYTNIYVQKVPEYTFSYSVGDVNYKAKTCYRVFLIDFGQSVFSDNSLGGVSLSVEQRAYMADPTIAMHGVGSTYAQQFDLFYLMHTAFQRLRALQFHFTRTMKLISMAMNEMLCKPGITVAVDKNNTIVCTVGENLRVMNGRISTFGELYLQNMPAEKRPVFVKAFYEHRFDDCVGMLSGQAQEVLSAYIYAYRTAPATMCDAFCYTHAALQQQVRTPRDLLLKCMYP
jgi:hypothetical protein